jgi:hypothetical protein
VSRSSYGDGPIENKFGAACAVGALNIPVVGGATDAIGGLDDGGTASLGEAAPDPGSGATASALRGPGR